MSPADLAASLYLLQNQDLPQSEWSPMPEGITADDIVRAIARQVARREATRRAVEEYKSTLSSAIPRSRLPLKCQVQNCPVLIQYDGVCRRCADEIRGTPLPLPWSTLFLWVACVLLFVACVFFLVPK